MADIISDANSHRIDRASIYTSFGPKFLGLKYATRLKHCFERVQTCSELF